MSDPLPVVCLSDIHGCWYTMVRLLNTIPKPFRLVLLGDLIDRGPHSRKVVEFAMRNNIPTCKGNHEDLAIDFYRQGKCHTYYDRGVWLNNGGDCAVPNWPIIDKRVLTGPQIAYAQMLGGRVPEDVLDWMEGLPPYIRFDDTTRDENGRWLLASHTGYGFSADDEDWIEALWGRYPDDGEFLDGGAFRVFGHTRTQQPIVTERFANIDTGAAYKGYGHLTAFIWPTKQTISVAYDESLVQPAFTVKDGVIAGV